MQTQLRTAEHGLSRMLTLIGSALTLVVVAGVGLAAPALAANPSLPPVLATVGTPLTPLSTVDLTGLVDPVSLTVTPALPSGLTLDAGSGSVSGTGIISGTPTVASATATFTVTATDSTPGTPVTRAVDIPITVDGQLTAPAPVTAILGQVLTGSPSFTVQGMTPPLTFTAPAAPAWLHFSTSGALSGIPDAVMADTTIPVSVTDSAGANAYGTFSLAVVGALVPATQVLGGVVGTILSSPTAAFPSSSSLGYAVSPDIAALTGLTFDPATGAISGTPTHPIAPTLFTIQQQAVPGSALLAQATVSVTIDGVLGTLPVTVSGIVGTSISPVTPYDSAAATSAGLTAPLAYSTSPLLPGSTGSGDLAINATTGVITGKPSTAVVAADYTVIVTDKNGARAKGPMSLTIAGSIVPASQNVTTAVSTTLSTKSLSPVGMTAPVTFAVSPPPPAGVNFSTTTGVFVGIPRNVQAATVYVVTATDATGATGTAKITLTVAKASLTAPVITSVVGGPKAGSIVVTFTPPRLAPTGQTYSVQVYDSLGIDLVTTVDGAVSPVTVEGLTPGDDYQVVVVANATSSFDRIVSLPKLGTASLTTTAVSTIASVSATHAATATTQLTADRAALARLGFVLATPKQAVKAKRVLVASAATTIASKAPVARIPLKTVVRVVVPGVTAKGLLQIRVRSGGAWLVLGYGRAGATQRLRLPAFSVRTVGSYSLLIAGATGSPTYVTVVVGR